LQIPKAQKDTDDLTVSFVLLGKAAHNMLVKLTPNQWTFFMELFFSARNASEFFTGGPYDMTSCWLEGGGTFGDYNCDSPLALIQSAIKFVQDESAKLPPDTFVIWTG